MRCGERQNVAWPEESLPQRNEPYIGLGPKDYKGVDYP